MSGPDRSPWSASTRDAPSWPSPPPQPGRRGLWCEVPDFVVLDREEDGSLEIGPREGFGGPQPTIILSPTDEPQRGRPRLHIDVNATDRDQDAELERLLKLGTRPADVGQTGEEPWPVLADPNTRDQQF
ncbi:VOC family protein [Streptomyces hygroscopicus]|uniref:VOC family protein n=1 Tax=Streptomyces hygroscopicus TaxID=1912 RepID=UPI00131B4367